MTSLDCSLQQEDYELKTGAECPEERYKTRLFLAAVWHIGKNWRKVKQALKMESVQVCKRKWEAMTEYDKQDARQYIQFKKKQMLARKEKQQQERRRQSEEQAKVNTPEEVQVLQKTQKRELPPSFFVEKVLPIVKDEYQGLYSLVQQPKKSKRIVKLSIPGKK